MRSTTCGRAPLELADCGPDEVEIGLRVEPTFRRLFTADEIHNYFWKVQPVRDVAPDAAASEGAG